MLTVLAWGAALVFNPYAAVYMFELPKFQFLFWMVIILSLFNAFRFRKIEIPRVPPHLVFLFLFLIANFVSYSFSVEPGVSFMGLRDRYQGLLTYVLYVLLSMNVFLIVKDFKFNDYNKLAKYIGLGTLVVALFAMSPYIFKLYIFDPINYYGRIYGTLGNPNFLASYLVFGFPFMLYAFQLYKPNRYFKYAILFLTIYAIYLTGSRSAWLVLLFAYGVYLFAAGSKLFKKFLTGVFVAGLLVVSYNVLNLDFNQRLSLNVENLTSVDTRFDLWTAGVEAIGDRPFFGYGQDTTYKFIDYYLPEDLRANNVFFIDRVHNEFLDLSLNLGLVGGFIYLALIFFCLRDLYRIMKKGGVFVTPLFVSLLALTVYHFLNFSTITSNIVLYLNIGICLAVFSFSEGTLKKWCK